MKKKWLALLLCVIAAVFGVCFTACNKNDDVEPVVITVSEAAENESLLDYMNGLQEDGKLTFTYSMSTYGAYITSINGISAATNTYWALYTNDTNADVNSGLTYDYNGETLSYSNLGASGLEVVNGCVYVWVYTTF